MSVQVIASTRRYHENPNTFYRQPVVEIRVAGLTFTVDVKNEQEAVVRAQRVASALRNHFRENP